MPWDKGFNFRQSAGYVTDGANETYVQGGGIGFDSYPTTRNGVTFGWEDTPSGDRDRNNALDRRLAGMHYNTTGATVRFRVDLPAAGDYSVRLAMGDASNKSGNSFSELRDTTTVLTSLTDEALNATHSKDITGTKHTFAAWPGSNSAQTFTFASTICRMALKQPSSGFSAIQHLFLSQVDPAGQPAMRRWGMSRGFRPVEIGRHGVQVI